MHTIDLLAGTTIENAARQLVGQWPARAEFNGITIRARYATTNPRDIVTEYRRRCDMRSIQYRASPEYRAEEAKREARRVTLRENADRLMGFLPDVLALADHGVAIKWLCEMQDPSDTIGVNVPAADIVAAFRAAGYEPGVNCGDDFNGDDRDNFARWLIGQALDGLERMGAIHGIVHRFANDWRARFGEVAS